MILFLKLGIDLLRNLNIVQNICANNINETRFLICLCIICILLELYCDLCTKLASIRNSENYCTIRVNVYISSIDETYIEILHLVIISVVSYT